MESSFPIIRAEDHDLSDIFFCIIISRELFGNKEVLRSKRPPSRDTKDCGKLSNGTLNLMLRLVLMAQQELVKYVFILYKTQKVESIDSHG